MLFEPGFLGTSAPFYMDFITIFFTVFPLLMGFSVFLAIKRKYKHHFISQAVLLAVTSIIIIIFEIGLRISGGFTEYAKGSDISYNFMLVFLTIHIVIAVISLMAWIYLFFSSFKAYKANNINTIINSNHKQIGELVFFGLSISALMGVCIYLFLFLF